MMKEHFGLVSPRVGLAYRLNDKTVIRTGGGIYYLPSNTYFANSPWGMTINQYTTSWLATLNSGVTPDYTISNPFPTERYALNFNFMLPARRWRVPEKELEDPMPGTWVDVPARSVCRIGVGLPTRRRGRRDCPRIRLSTRFPFGLWEAWSYLRPGLSTIIYPSPESDAPPLPAFGSGRDESGSVAPGGDEFSGVRPYQPGDPQKMIAWRLAARSDELSVKFFESAAGGDVMLDFDRLAPDLSVEQRISRLASWVLMAEAAGLSYGLQLRGTRIELGHGHEHSERCLEALALFES